VDAIIEDDYMKALYIGMMSTVKTNEDVILEFLMKRLPYLFDRVGNAALRGGVNARTDKIKNMTKDMDELYKPKEKKKRGLIGRMFNFPGSNKNVQIVNG